MRPLTLQRLEVFRAIHELGSITSAARELKLTQPTVSRHLRDLEAAIGLTLFEVDRGRLRPTADGDELFLECRHLKDQLVRVESRIEALRSGTSRTLIVRSIGPLVHEHLPRAVSTARDRLPSLDLLVDTATADEQIRALRAGRIDLGFVAGPLPPIDCRVEKIGSGRLVVLAPSDHAFAQCDHVTHDQVREACTYIRLHPSGPIGGLATEQIGQKSHISRPGLTVQTFNLAAGFCAALRSPVIVDEFTAGAARAKGISALPIVPAVAFEIVAISNPLTGRTRAHDILIEEMRKSLEAHRPS